MVRLIGQRLVQLPLVIVAVSVLVFMLIQVVPGDVGRNALGPYATAEQVAAWNTAHGLDGGALAQYMSWIGGLATGDWGTSLVYGVPVRDLVPGRLLNSIALGMLAFAILVPPALALAAFQARVEGSLIDRSLTIVVMALAAIPEFVIGVLLLVAFAVAIPLFPVQSMGGTEGGLLPPLRAMILPAITLAIGWFALVARTARTGALEAMKSQYHRTAVVKGLSTGAVFRRHLARNSLASTVALLGISLGALLGGSAVVETLFGYPGLGELIVTATQRKDAPLLAVGVMATGVISVLGVLAADIAFVLMDPRVRFERGE